VERNDWIVPVGGKEKHATARLSVLVAAALALLKIGTWLVTGSVAVLASAADSLMDVFASAVNWFAIRVADEPEDACHRFGHGKAEGMAGLFQSIVIGASALYLVYESVARLIEPEEIERPFAGIAVMGVSMIATVLLVRRIRRVARESESIALEAESLHFLSDVLANGAVILGLAVYHVFGFAWVDPVVSLGIALWILRSVRDVFMESFDNLMDRQLPEEEQKTIDRILRERVPEARGFHDLRTRRSGARRFIHIHVEIERGTSFVDAHRITEKVTIEIERGLPNARVITHADPWPPDADAYREPSPEKPPGGEVRR